MNRDPLSFKALLSYGSIALPLAFAGLPFYIHAPDFYMRTQGISLAAMGTILLIIRSFDAVQDPFIGRLGDIFSNRRVSIIIGALALLGGGFAALYNPPDTVSPIAWFCGSMLISTFAFSTIAINLNALGSLWSQDSEQKTRIANAREGLGLIGLLLATLMPTLLQLRWNAANSFQIYAGIFLLITFVTAVAFYKWGQRYAPSFKAAPQPFFSWISIAPVASPRLATFFGAYSLSLLSSSIPGVLVLIFVRDRLVAQNFTGLFLTIYFLAGVLGLPLWRWLASRIGKKETWLVAMILAVSSFVWAYTLAVGELKAFGMICFLSGIALGAELVLPTSIASDIIDQESIQHLTSMVFAVMHFLSKLALAFASGFAFLLLSKLHYDEGPSHTASNLHALSFIYALLPCFIKAIAASVVGYIIWHERGYRHDTV